jgi:hypothetical protein
MSNLADWTFLDAAYRRGLVPEPHGQPQSCRSLEGPEITSAFEQLATNHAADAGSVGSD